MTYRDPKTGRWAPRPEVHPFADGGGGMSQPLSPAKTTVFVYGTLKRGLWNHRHLEKSSFIGEGTTMDCWLVYGSYAPMAFPVRDEGDEQNAYPVRGELYEVDDATLERLNRLEGYRGPDHPGNLYDRVTVAVAWQGGVREAQMYAGHRNPSDFRGQRPYTNRDAGGAIVWRPEIMQQARGKDHGRTEQSDG